MNKNSIQEEDINYESIEDVEKKENNSIELMQHIANTIKEKIAEEENNIKELKRLPIGIFILIFTFVAVTVGYTFTNPILSYFLSILFYGIIASLSVWGFLKSKKAYKNKENLEDKLDLIKEEIRAKRIKSVCQILNLQNNVAKEFNMESVVELTMDPTMESTKVMEAISNLSQEDQSKLYEVYGVDVNKPMVRSRVLTKEETKR